MIPPDDVPGNAKTAASQDGIDDEQRSAPARIRGLLMAQSYAVLCTQSQSQPYGSLIAFAASVAPYAVVGCGAARKLWMA